MTYNAKEHDDVLDLSAGEGQHVCPCRAVCARGDDSRPEKAVCAEQDRDEIASRQEKLLRIVTGEVESQSPRSFGIGRLYMIVFGSG